MCQSKSDGGRRCPGTASGAALDRMYKERKAGVDRDQQIAAVRDGISLYGGRFVTPMSIDLPAGVEHALTEIQEVGNPLLVGGVVRDSVRGAENKDYDIEVYGVGLDELSQHLKNRGFRVNEVGKQFGVLKVSKRGVVTDLDVSVPRVENRVGAGHRDFEVQVGEELTVQQAAARRDFTFNAMLYDHQRQLLVDPSNGKQDLEAGIMRHVSPKFAEDPLRVLRGVQLAARFDMTMSDDTLRMCRSLRSEAGSLPTERIQEEFRKLFGKATVPAAGIRVLQESGWDDVVPGMREAIEADPHALDNLPNIPKEQRHIIGPAILARHVPDEHLTKFLHATVIGNQDQRTVRQLRKADSSVLADREARHHFMNENPHWDYELYRSYSEAISDPRGTEVADQAASEGISHRPAPDLLSGNDIMQEAGRKGGRWLGPVVKELRSRQYAGQITTPEQARTALHDILDQ